MMTTVAVIKPRLPVYTEGPPLDGGAGPGVLAGDSRHDNTPTSGGEIGVIVGVVLFITLIILAVFVWRSRKFKRDKANAAAAAADGHAPEDNLQSGPIADEDRDAARFSTIENDKDLQLVVEQTPRAVTTAHWKTWGKSDPRDGGTSH